MKRMLTLMLVGLFICSVMLVTGAVSVMQVDSYVAERANVSVDNYIADQMYNSANVSINSNPVYYRHSQSESSLSSISSSSSLASEDSLASTSKSSSTVPNKSPVATTPTSSSSVAPEPSSSSSSSASSSEPADTTPPAENIPLYETPIMGTSVASAEQLVSYYYRYTSSTPKLNCSLYDLATYFITEGAKEGVRGDIAFIQSILETGWFRYGGAVLWTDNNYCGLGATGVSGQVAKFETPQQGVQAQIQHLKAYASTDPLNGKLVDPRFYYVSPRGKAPLWMDLSGTWAMDTTYGTQILNNYSRLLEVSVSSSAVEKSKIEY